jgi:hypothetical protein
MLVWWLYKKRMMKEESDKVDDLEGTAEVKNDGDEELIGGASGKEHGYF